MAKALSIAAYDMPETRALEELVQQLKESTQVSVTVCRLAGATMEKDVLRHFEARSSKYDLVDVSSAALVAFAPYLQPLDEWIESHPETEMHDWAARILELYARDHGRGCRPSLAGEPVHVVLPARPIRET